jgi:general stress protein 26
MRGTGLEKEVEICATNTTNKSKRTDTNAMKRGKNCEDTRPHLNQMTKTDPVSETSWFFSQEHRTMEEVQNPSNSVCYKPSSEPFKNLRVGMSLEKNAVF